MSFLELCGFPVGCRANWRKTRCHPVPSCQLHLAQTKPLEQRWGLSSFFPDTPCLCCYRMEPGAPVSLPSCLWWDQWEGILVMWRFSLLAATNLCQQGTLSSSAPASPNRFHCAHAWWEDCYVYALLGCPGCPMASKKYGYYLFKAKMGTTVPLILLANLGAVGLVK